MSSELICIGPSHRTARVAARERFALRGAPAESFARELLGDPDVLEVVVLDTCSRSEVYVHASNTDRGLDALQVALARVSDLSLADLQAVTSTWLGDEAARHLFEVASGLDSFVLGENEILGQVKSALRTSHEAGVCGPFLDRLVRHALEVGKSVRTQTDISAGNASIGSVAAELLESRLGRLENRAVLVIGAGDMARLAVRSIAARGATDIVVANRNLARANQIVQAYGGRAVSFQEMPAYLPHADAVVAATAAPHVVLTADALRAARAGAGRQQLPVLDLAMPRDVEPEVGSVPEVELYDLDALEARLAGTRAARAEAARAAEAIVAGAVAEFAAWRRSLDVVPAIRSLRARAEVIRTRELERFEGRLRELAPEHRQLVDQLTRGLVNKLLHQPTTRLRERAVEDGDGEASRYEEVVRHLFALEPRTGAR